MGVLENLDLENVPELSAVAEGEYEVRIMDAGDHVSKTSGQNMIRVVLEIVGEPEAETLYHYITLPQFDDDERKKNGKLRRIKEFLSAFNLDQQSEYPEWIGLTGWALIGSETDERTGAPRNNVKRFIASK
jgi:hypothetical protein